MSVEVRSVLMRSHAGKKLVASMDRYRQALGKEPDVYTVFPSQMSTIRAALEKYGGHNKTATPVHNGRPIRVQR